MGLVLGPLIASLLLGVGVGVGLGWWLAHRRGRRRQGRRRISQGLRGLPVRQFLGWVDSSPNGWVILDRLNRVVHINPRAERLLQIDSGRLWQGAALASLCPQPAILDTVQLARRQDRPQRLEWSSPEGELEVLAMPGGEGWLAVLLQSRRSLEAQLEQQERWVSDVAHELKTPLTALLLVGDSLSAQVTSHNVVLVERLQRELLRLQQLVGDLLELSRLENSVPGASARQDPIDPAALFEQVWQGLRPLAEQRQLVLEWLQLDSDPSTGQLLRIPGDGARLHRALLNLLDNALRYSPQAGVLSVSIQSRGDWCVIGLRDRGPGLSEEDLEHLFERFYRGDPSRVKGSRTGSGLGLAIVQQIAVGHGGRVQASNHPQGGALMELILPRLSLPLRN